MQSQHYPAADLAALGREWISAWNSHDLERILALYADDAEMTSDKIQALGLAASSAAVACWLCMDCSVSARFALKQTARSPLGPRWRKLGQ